MAAPRGTPIYAAESGVVIVNQWMGGYGNCIIIDHGGGLWTLYGHLLDGSSVVEKGETVKRGQKIASVGMTGTATGYHLHFEVRKNEKPVNPLPYIR
jgi:murein DD-endopeptidase MepM/ murein hydrolase activator NlpD